MTFVWLTEQLKATIKEKLHTTDDATSPQLKKRHAFHRSASSKHSEKSERGRKGKPLKDAGQGRLIKEEKEDIGSVMTE